MPSESEVRFIVKAIPNQTAVLVFTPSSIAPATITEALKAVSRKFQGSSVAGADFAKFPIEEGAASSTYVYGVAGLLDFKTKQPLDLLANAVEAIEHALIARHFGIYSDD